MIQWFLHDSVHDIYINTYDTNYDHHHEPTSWTSSPGTGSEVGNSFAEVFPRTPCPICVFGFLGPLVVSCFCLRTSGFRCMCAGARVLFLVSGFLLSVAWLLVSGPWCLVLWFPVHGYWVMDLFLWFPFPGSCFLFSGLGFCLVSGIRFWDRFFAKESV